MKRARTSQLPDTPTMRRLNPQLFGTADAEPADPLGGGIESTTKPRVCGATSLPVGGSDGSGNRQCAGVTCSPGCAERRGPPAGLATKAAKIREGRAWGEFCVSTLHEEG